MGTTGSQGAITLSKLVSSSATSKAGSIDLVAVHSHAKLARDCRIQVGNGLLGWVADHGKPIHLTPSTLSSSAVGIYANQEAIKSLIAVPIPIKQGDSGTEARSFGVLMCDSLVSASFTKPHVKLLDEIAAHTARMIQWVQGAMQTSRGEASWDLFKEKTHQLGEAIGHSSVEIIRISMTSFAQLEATIGISAAVQTTEQFIRLAQQALPPHFPLTKLPSGEILVAVDNMMSSFFRQKLQTLADRLSSPQKPFAITFSISGAKLDRTSQGSFESTFQQIKSTKELHQQRG
jgi:hypothetical protein